MPPPHFDKTSIESWHWCYLRNLTSWMSFQFLILVLALTILNYLLFSFFSEAPHQPHYFQCYFRCLSSYVLIFINQYCCNQEYWINQWSCVRKSLRKPLLMFHLHLYSVCFQNVFVVWILPAMNDLLVKLNVLVFFFIICSIYNIYSIFNIYIIYKIYIFFFTHKFLL